MAGHIASSREGSAPPDLPEKHLRRRVETLRPLLGPRKSSSECLKRFCMFRLGVERTYGY
eukprot:7751157-Alexandrium_andersonii.AAC.1